MSPFDKNLAVLALIGTVITAPCAASSTAASSASDSIATSVGSVSDSIKNSSDSSSKNKQVAEGDYKIIEMAAMPDRAGTLRLKLQALTDASETGAFDLYLPQEVVVRHGLTPDQTVTVRQRAYGLEFAVANTQQAFFLVLADDWYRELKSVAVVL